MLFGGRRDVTGVCADNALKEETRNSVSYRSFVIAIGTNTCRLAFTVRCQAAKVSSYVIDVCGRTGERLAVFRDVTSVVFYFM